MKKIKIAVVYHRQSMVVKDSVYTPVLAGASVTTQKSKDGRLFLDPEFLREMSFRDDEGDGVSQMNRSINEMSVVYWMWKNYAAFGNPDYVGLAHYRRFLITGELQSVPPHRWFPNAEAYLYNDARRFLSDISSDRYERLLAENDVLCSYRYAAAAFRGGRPVRCCRDRYINLMGEAKAGLYDAMERLVLAARPDFAPEVDYMRSHADHYLCNMFVMPRVQFFEYCEFIFPILFELVRLNADEHDVHGVRAPGFLSEFLTSIYLAHLVREGRLRIKPLRLACWGIPAHGFLRYVIRSILPDGVRHWLKKRLRIN